MSNATGFPSHLFTKEVFDLVVYGRKRGVKGNVDALWIRKREMVVKLLKGLIRYRVLRLRALLHDERVSLGQKGVVGVTKEDWEMRRKYYLMWVIRIRRYEAFIEREGGKVDKVLGVYGNSLPIHFPDFGRRNRWLGKGKEKV